MDPQSICLVYDARHLGCPVDLFATDSSERSSTRLARRPWLVLNQDLTIHPRVTAKSQ